MLGWAQRGGGEGSASLGLLLALSGAVVLAFTGLLAGLFVASLDRSGRQLAIAGNSQEQLLLAMRIDRTLAVPGGGRVARALIGAYARSIRDEEAMGGRPSGEERDAVRFGILLGRLDRKPAAAADRAALRGLTARIVARERAEVARVAADSFRLRRQARWLAALLVASLAVLLLLGGLWLHRLVVRPLTGMRDAAARMGEGGDGHVRPQGPAEFRRLAAHFNDMVDRVTTQHEALDAAVRARTADLSERNRRLADIDRSRRLFFSKVSHELRTPVSVMRGEAEVALRSPPLQPEALGHVVANAGFLQRRLDDLLALARSDEGRLTLAPAPLDLAALAREAMAAAEPFARSSGVALLGSALDRPLMIEGDATWLRQALLAVIDNAVKFAGMEPVALRLVRGTGGASLVLLDRGPGVAAAELARIFDPYVQTEAGRARGGSGLGLSLARWVVAQHGGGIEARRRRGGGIAIVMRLPTP